MTHIPTRRRILFFPLLLLIWLRWVRHEGESLKPYRCDGGEQGKDLA